MRKTVFTLLAVAVFCSIHARANTIDNFVLTGNGDTITFSLPASPPGNLSTCPTSGPISCLPGSETAFYLSAPVTVDGVTSQQSLAFSTFRFGGGLSLGLNPGRLVGSQLFGPDAATPSFILGTYTLGSLNFTGPIPVVYTLTISAEEPTAVTAEPRTLTLFATGVGLFALVGVRPRSVPI